MRPTTIKIECPKCGAIIFIHSDFVMQKIQCGKCNKRFKIEIKKEVEKSE